MYALLPAELLRLRRAAAPHAPLLSAPMPPSRRLIAFAPATRGLAPPLSLFSSPRSDRTTSSASAFLFQRQQQLSADGKAWPRHRGHRRLLRCRAARLTMARDNLNLCSRRCAALPTTATSRRHLISARASMGVATHDDAAPSALHLPHAEEERKDSPSRARRFSYHHLLPPLPVPFKRAIAWAW